MVPARFVVSVFVSVSVSVAPLVFRAPSDPAVGPGCWLCPWAAARPRAVRAASLRLGASSRSPARPRHRPRAPQPGPPLPPAPSTPAVPVVLVCPARPRHRPRAPQPGSLFSPAPSTPAGPVVLVCPARPRRHSRASPLMLTNFARNSPTTVSNLECASLELQRFQRLLKLPSNELRATFLEPAVSYVLHQRIQECSVFRGPTVPRGCAWFGHSWGVRTSL